MHFLFGLFSQHVLQIHLKTGSYYCKKSIDVQGSHHLPKPDSTIVNIECKGRAQNIF